MYFNSFAFLDLETTSLCRPKITEIALVACERRHLEDSEVLPRVLHKFTVCVKPSMKVHPITTEITGQFCITSACKLPNPMWDLLGRPPTCGYLAAQHRC